MSKPWNPGKETVALGAAPRPSRIRREPVRVDPQAEGKPRSPEREKWAAAAGVLFVAVGSAALMVGLSEVTSSDGSAQAAASAGANAGPGFGYCRNGEGSNCVLDGDSFIIAGQRVEIAGADAPEIYGSACPEEARRGVQAAARLRLLINSGPVAVTKLTGERGGGPLVRKVAVNGVDVGTSLTAAGLARDSASTKSWCG